MVVGKGKEKAAPPPDELRCNRTDGRQWRCSRWSLDGKKLCEIHYLQGRHRQYKRKVPDSLKIERKRVKFKNQKSKGVKIGNGLEVKGLGSSKMSRVSLAGVVEKRRRCAAEALDEALKKMKLKRGDLQLELLRVFLKRRVEKKKENEKEERKSDEGNEARELELPNARMEISMEGLDNAGAELDVKVGSGVDGSSGAAIQRNFRSKNIEVAPISTMQVAPIVDIKKRKPKKCHWCRKSGHQSLIKCLNCKKRFFCLGCVKERSECWSFSINCFDDFVVEYYVLCYQSQ